VEAGLTVGARRRAQRPVQPVRPRVVGTLQRFALSRAACDDVTPMTADVDERTQDAVARACNHYGNLSGNGREERALLRDLAGMADVLPATREDARTLAAQHVGVGVPAPRKRSLHGCEL